MNITNQKAHIPCNSCGQNTNHSMHGKNVHKSYYEPADLHFTIQSLLFTCDGCNTPTLQVDQSDSDSDGSTTTFYPPRLPHQQPKWLPKLHFVKNGDVVIDYMNEIYKCLANECNRAASNTCRALIEHIFNKEIKDIGGFEAKLQELENLKLITPQNRKILDAVVEVGHGSMHRDFRPTNEQIQLVVEVVEGMVQARYLHAEATQQLKKAVPARKRKPKKPQPKAQPPVVAQKNPATTSAPVQQKT